MKSKSRISIFFLRARGSQLLRWSRRTKLVSHRNPRNVSIYLEVYVGYTIEMSWHWYYQHSKKMKVIRFECDTIYDLHCTQIRDTCRYPYLSVVTSKTCF